MSNPRAHILWALLVGALPSCGGGGETQTCVANAITYSGSKSGAAYLRITGNNGLNFADNAPSIQVLMAIENSSVTCYGDGQQIDIPVTAAVWIDVSGASATICADLKNPQCQPSPTDPQAHQSAVLRYGQTTVIHLDVVDPP